MALTLVDIRLGVHDKYTAQTITDVQLNRYIASAIRRYSNYNPIEKSTTLTTVADQQDYTLPSDFLFMRNAEYYPSGQLFGQLYVGSPTSEYELMIRHPARYHNVSDRTIENIDRQALADASKGKWEIVGNNTLRLWPTPASASDYDYYYGAAHALNTGGTGYNDIPTADLSIVVDLSLAEVLEAFLMDVSTEFDYAEGLERVTKHFVPENISAVIDRLRTTVANKYRKPLVLLS